VKPWLAEFNAKAAKRSPEEFVLSRNLRRRHLSVGQKAAIALDWSEQTELNLEPEKTKALGRPKGALSEAAKYIGINEQRVFEVRQIRDSNLALYREVKAGRRSLNSALAEVSPPREDQFDMPGTQDTSPTAEEPSFEAQNETGGNAPHSAGKLVRDAKMPAHREPTVVLRPPPKPAAVEKALARIKATLGSWFYAEVKARNLIQKSEEIIQFGKLTNAQMLEIGPFLKKGWTYAAAFREVIERLTPDDEIRALHTRAIENGEQWYLSSVGNFGHVVVWGTEKDKALAKIKETLAKPSASYRSGL
jgi:hypothetical protein